MSGGWYETLAVEEVYRGRARVVVETIGLPDGSSADREIAEIFDAVAVVPVTRSGMVLLLRQYRHATGSYLLEIPAGVLDVDGEAPEDAARRELAEEVQHEAGRLEHLVTFHNSAGWTRERTHVFLAHDCVPGGAPADFEAEAEEADMEVVPMALADAVEAAHSGQVTDAKTLVGLLLADARGGDAAGRPA